MTVWINLQVKIWLVSIPWLDPTGRRC